MWLLGSGPKTKSQGPGLKNIVIIARYAGKKASLDIRRAVPLFVCALWLLLFLCAGVSFSKRNKRICSFLWRKEKEPKKHPPPPSLTSSSSITTRKSRSKLHSSLAAPSVPPILGGCNWLRSETNLCQSFGMTYGAFALRVSHDCLIVTMRK